jgi:hypothetical protein
MPLVLDGNGTIAGISAGGLPDNSITAADLASSLDLSGKTVTLSGNSSGLSLISTATVSGTVANIEIDFDTTTYKNYIIYWEGIQGTADFNMYGLVKVSGSYDTGSNYSSQHIKKYGGGFDSSTYGGGGTNQFFISHNVGAASFENWNCIMDINLGTGTGMPLIRFSCGYKDDSGGYVGNFGILNYQNFNVLQGFRLYPSTGSFDTGRYTVYGVK